MRLSYRSEKDGSRPGHWGSCDAPLAQVAQGVGGRGDRQTTRLLPGALRAQCLL